MILRETGIDISKQSVMKDLQIIQMEEERPNQFLIDEIIFYGILEPDKLTVQDLHCSTPAVGVNKRFIKGKEMDSNNDSNLQMWAYPDGIKIFDHHLNVINDTHPEESFGKEHTVKICIDSGTRKKPSDLIYSFVHTDYSLNRNYFTALCWHQSKLIPLKRTKFQDHSFMASLSSLPKCTLGELENEHSLMDEEKSLVYIPHLIIVGSTRPFFNFQRDLLKFYYRNVIAETSNPVVSLDTIEYFKDLVHVAGYPQAEVEFNFYTKEDFPKKKEYIEIKRHNLLPFFTSFFFIPKISEQGSSIHILDCPNSSVRFRQVSVAQQCFQLPNIPIVELITKIGIKNMLILWKNMILERHILVFSMNNNAVIDLFESLLYLLEPVIWQNIYIPFLPFHLVNNIEAIQSYLIGMSRIHMDHVIEHYQHRIADLVLFDLDQNILIEKTQNKIDIPVQLRDVMEQRLSVLGFRKDHILSFLFKTEEKKMTETQKIMGIKCIFFDGLIYLLNNYRNFAALKQDDVLSFDREGYISMFADKKEWVSFAEQLIETMIFTRLCEYHLEKEKILQWNQSHLGGLFVYCQNIISDRNPKGFWQLPPYQKKKWQWEAISYHQYRNYVLQKNIKKLNTKPKVFYVQTYLIKYLKWLEMEVETKSSFLNQRDENAKKVNIYECLLEFIFPWIKQLQIPLKNGNFCIDSELKVLKCIDLNCLFGLNPEKQALMKQSRKQLQKELKAYREKKNRFFVSFDLGSKKRISAGQPLKREDRFSV